MTFVSGPPSIRALCGSIVGLSLGSGVTPVQDPCFVAILTTRLTASWWCIKFITKSMLLTCERRLLLIYV